jgi:Uma2 family endonuclease
MSPGAPRWKNTVVKATKTAWRYGPPEWKERAMSATTTRLPAQAPAGAEWLPMPLYRLTLGQYERMVDEGILGDHDRVHLINGILVAKMTQNDPHCAADDLCDDALRRIIPTGWYIRGAKPVRIPGRAGRRDSKPEPDRCVVRGTVRDYEERTPGPADVGLVVEIADTSLAEDRKYATELYGPARIPVYWIVNLLDRQVEVYTDPGPQGYRRTAVFKEGRSVPVVIGGREVGRIAVADILPSRRRRAKAERDDG